MTPPKAWVWERNYSTMSPDDPSTNEVVSRPKRPPFDWRVRSRSLLCHMFVGIGLLFTPIWLLPDHGNGSMHPTRAQVGYLLIGLGLGLLLSNFSHFLAWCWATANERAEAR